MGSYSFNDKLINDHITSNNVSLKLVFSLVCGYCLLIKILDLITGDQLINFHYLSLVM
jgi:hypothetical protein